ncbi:hypothetical protein [Marinifilum caeruleilacunae]|uniref:Uncharacterized protein n=1 Tax=Marinifilum caeruleilacunae TaxID=2499076 RepID=A0ABX1X189_9BACT|nr:hypothetical protein [Marinifilum caeruleilacunae]NOU62137.1 hypothetical protein [Marinifilum caeruleilacunae]
MRRSASEKMENIRIVEGSELVGKRTLEEFVYAELRSMIGISAIWKMDMRDFYLRRTNDAHTGIRFLKKSE